MLKYHVYWWTKPSDDGKDNFGDILTKYLIEKISKKEIVKVTHPSMRRYRYIIKHYLTIGSILELANKNSIVWGSGIIRKNQFVKEAKFLAVRGPRTRNRLLELGYKVPEIYGDPAILLPLHYPNVVKKKYKLGIIPHIVNYEEIHEQYKDDHRIKIINFLTDNIENTINDILDCERIISSSLHGVIVAQSYLIPCLWVKFTNKLAGDNVKFYDYLESVNIFYEKEFDIEIKKYTFEKIIDLIAEYHFLALPDLKILKYRQQQLVDSCPFNKSIFKMIFT